MHSRGGNSRGRLSRAGGNNGSSNATAEKIQQGLSSSSSTTQADKRSEGQTATSSSETGNFTIIQAIINNRSNSRLDSVQRLLKNVVSGAASVVRGTDSQRRFTSTYTEFCLSAMRCMADLEDAVFEYTHPGRRAADARDDEIDGIAEDVFLKQVAAYVSTHTKSLGLAYLEHVALGALEKQQNQRKRERTSANSGGRAAKASRTGGHSGVGGGRSAGSNSGISVADGASASSDFDTLGLIDAHDTMREALHILEQEKSATATGSVPANNGNSRRRGQQAVTASIGKHYTEDRSLGIIVSKASSAGAGPASSSTGSTSFAGDQVVYDLRNPQLKLSSIPELSTRLQPWTIPLSSSGVFLERVTMERERKATSGGHASATTTTPGVNAGTNNGHHTFHREPTKTTLDVCLSQSPMELLHRYEAHEAALAAEPQSWQLSSPSISAGPYSVVPYAGKRGVAGGGSPRSTASLLPTPSLFSVPPNEVGGGSAPHDADALGNASADADALACSAFFPAVRENRSLTCLPQFVMSNLSHFGVSRMEFVYTMTPVPKQS
ncbi:hypothetical protein ABL78_3608 [Leptomonas seymouri]|uniref:Uncharacterized protein n=1 Tax=Leptomonas seymouri TaxID=5684 RepID=A0A0N1PEM3_LEPSE|nr:hypothetical protein ABL78_3608 [Leptomonas seymouri]|eukprot:KPI87325.1 hypothetical protein ABL78_3608 [Leptomonas seymouri]